MTVRPPDGGLTTVASGLQVSDQVPSKLSHIIDQQHGGDGVSGNRLVVRANQRPGHVQAALVSVVASPAAPSQSRAKCLSRNDIPVQIP